MGHRRYSCT